MILTRFHDVATRSQPVLADISALLIRLTLGQGFMQAGWGKLHTLKQTTEYFAGLGIPAAGIQAPFVATLEFVGGAALILGLGTRLAALLLLSTMVVALATAHRTEFLAALRLVPEGDTGITSVVPWMWGLLLLVLVAHGAGRISLDALLSRKRHELAARGH